MESGGKREVVFTHGTGKKYGISPSSYDRQMKELCANGFIEPVEDEDMAQFAPNKYRFMFGWKNKWCAKVAPHFGEGNAQNPPQNGEGKG